MKNDVYQTHLTSIFKDQFGILHVVFNDKEKDFDLIEAKEQIEVVNKLINQKPTVIIIDTRLSFQTPTEEAKKILAEFQYKKSEAIIVKHLHQRITSNFFLKLSHRKSKHPVKLFTDEKKAIEWSLKYTQQREYIVE